MSVSMIAISMFGRASGITVEHRTTRPRSKRSRRMSLRFLLPACVALVLSGPTAASAQQNAARAEATSPAPTSLGITPAEAQRALSVLQDPQQRTRLVETLRTIAKAASAASADAVPATEATSAEPASEKSGDAKPAPVTLKPNSLAAQIISRLSGWPQRVAEDAAASLRTVPDLYLLREWIARMVSDPTYRGLALDVAWQLALVLGAAVLLDRFTSFALHRSAARLAARAPDPGEATAAGDRPWHLLRRLPAAAARFALEIVPVTIFWIAATLLTGLVQVPLTRMAISIAINAYVAIRAMFAIGRMLLAPETSGLRLLNLDDDRAGYLMRWLSRLTLVAVIGGAVAGLALLFGLHPAACATLIRVLGLVVAVLLGIMVLQLRVSVASLLRAAPEGEPVPAWREWLAAVWHYLALLAIAVGWIGWAAGLETGAGGIWILLGTAATITGARLVALVVIGVLDRATEPRADGEG